MFSLYNELRLYIHMLHIFFSIHNNKWISSACKKKRVRGIKQFIRNQKAIFIINNNNNGRIVFLGILLARYYYFLKVINIYWEEKEEEKIKEETST